MGTSTDHSRNSEHGGLKRSCKLPTLPPASESVSPSCAVRPARWDCTSGLLQASLWASWLGTGVLGHGHTYLNDSLRLTG